MKRIYHHINRVRIAQMIAMLLIVCMGSADASIYLNHLQSEENIEDGFCVIKEEHELETAMADGHYDGNNSDSESKDSGIVVSSEGKHLFNILEIVPTEKKGIIGYTIGGCEPFEEAKGIKSGNDYIVTPQQMRTAYMDALVNPTPGAYTEHQTNADSVLDSNTLAGYLKSINAKMIDSSVTEPFSFVMGNYNGYYKKVPNGKGVYALDSRSGNDAVMHSRFYYNSGNFNYIFVYSDAPSTDPDDINVTNHKRVKYTNNDKFIVDFLGVSDPQTWKEAHVTEVVTRTPANTTLEDIERADIIFINNGDQMDYYKYAVKVKNLMKGENEANNISDMFSPTIDFDSFEKVIKIYERVVVREDVAIVVEKLVCPNKTTDGFTTNMHKLMCMLFYVNKGSEQFAGRDLFTDYLKRYTSEPGKEYMELRKLYKDNKKWVAEGDGGHWEADPHFPDYRAISLRSTEDESNPSYYYMHTHNDWHVGHPLVLSQDMAITGGSFNSNGVLEPIRGGSANLHPITLERTDKSMFEDAHIDYKERTSNVKDTSIYYGRRETNSWYEADPNGEYVQMGGYNEFDSNGNWIRYIDMYYDIPADGNYRGKQRFTRKANYEFYSDPNGEYVLKNGQYVIATDDDVIYKGLEIYYHEGAYESMSNTTDYIYIDNNGTLKIDNKYSSDIGPYWYRIDYDGGINGAYAFRRRIWQAQDYTTWPWDADLSVWLMKRKDETPNSYDCNLHMWYDYNAFRGDADRYTGHINDSPFDHTYRNETLMEENGMMKGTWISDALAGRKIKREEENDIKHMVDGPKTDYYISMNVLNGDGVNETNPAARNKTLYYNQYEEDDIKAYETNNSIAKIPLNIRVRSSCKIKEIKVYMNSLTGPVLVSYNINDDVGLTELSASGSPGGKTLTLTPDNVMDESGVYPELKTDPGKIPIYTYEGQIFDVTSDNYMNKRNAKFIIELAAEAPDGSIKKVTDEITIVKRDFFNLN